MNIIHIISNAYLNRGIAKWLRHRLLMPARGGSNPPTPANLKYEFPPFTSFINFFFKKNISANNKTSINIDNFSNPIFSTTKLKKALKCKKKV